MVKYYKLDGHKTVLCDGGVLQWGRSFEEQDRHVGDVTLPNGVRISTVFLGLDHNFDGVGDPILFETMIFGGANDQYQERCSTWEQAEEMHKKAVELASKE